MRNTTSETSRRVTISHQKQKKPVANPYLKKFTTNRRNTAPGSLSLLVNGKENSAANSAATVVSKKTGSRRRLELPLHGLATSATAVSNKTTSTDALRTYAMNIKKDTNAGGIFTKDQQGMVAKANKNTKPYTNRTSALEEQFFRILTECSKGKDELIHNMCTETVFIERTLSTERLFYQILSGEKTESKRLVLNRCCNIYTLNIKNTWTKQPLDFTTQNQYLKQVFNIFHLKGILYRQGDFYGEGGLLGVVKQDYENKLEEDNTLGTGRTKAQFDEEAELKYQAALRKGDLKPFANDTDLIRCLVMGLGMKCGFRGRKEIALATWDFFDIIIIETGPNKGLTKISARPGGGWDKSHKLGIKNGNTRSQKPSLLENRLDPNCFVKLVVYYRKYCDKKQVRFLCYPKNSRISKIRFKANTQVGEKKVLAHVRYVAKLCGFKDVEKYATHDNRHQCGTAIYSNPNIPDKEKLAHMRHSKMQVAEVYTHTNKVTQGAVQNALHFGLHSPATLFPDAKVGIDSKPSAIMESKPEAPIEQKPKPAQEEERPVLAVESKPALLVPSQSAGMKRNAVSELDYNHLQRKYKKLKKSNTYNLEEARKERAEMSSTAIELQKKYDVAKEEADELALKLRVKTIELTTIEGSLDEKKNENIIVKAENNEIKQELQRTKQNQRTLTDENKELKQDLQRTKEEMNRRESEQRMLEKFQQMQQQQQQPKCAIM